ncbi:MAG: tyrosine-type recombinase/integrase [Hyphomicrobiaceae bacterium]
MPDYICPHGRHGFRYQRKVPKHLQALIGKTHIVRYLTGPKEDAKNKAIEHAAEDQRVFDTLSKANGAERAAVLAHGGYLDAKDFAQGTERDLGQLQAFFQATRDAAGFDDWVARLRRVVPNASPGDVALALRKMEAEHVQRQLQFATVRRVIRKASGSGGGSLEALIPIWQATNKPRSQKVVKKMGTFVARFIEVVGDKAPGEIERKDVLAFRDAVQERYTRSNAVKHLENIHALFRAAVKAGKLDINPAHDVKVLGKAEDDGEELIFEAKQVRAIFKATKSQPMDYQWLVKLLAYHGMRSGEAVALRTDDVTVSMGIPVLKIRQVETGSMKTKQSRREIPIHPKCMGIIAYAQSKAGPYLFDSRPVA